MCLSKELGTIKIEFWNKVFVLYQSVLPVQKKKPLDKFLQSVQAILFVSHLSFFQCRHRNIFNRPPFFKRPPPSLKINLSLLPNWRRNGDSENTKMPASLTDRSYFFCALSTPERNTITHSTLHSRCLCVKLVFQGKYQLFSDRRHLLQSFPFLSMLYLPCDVFG